ncbi:MAG: DUF2189 domain-containing protein [Proteobacteria bacterium]|nr:MAG: DUF2189 domain-containing protein [Pseudomonadota bacterium]
MDHESPTYRQQPALQRVSYRDIRNALAFGWRTFRRIPGASVGFASIFVFIGLALLAGVGWFGFSPMALPFAGGFLLVGPVLLGGFFELAVRDSQGRRARFVDAARRSASPPPGILVISLVCAFLFLVWITDAAVLYSFMVGTGHLPYKLPWLIDLKENVVGFELLSSLMGSVLAFIIFAISAFSVPLVHEHRTSLVQAIYLSVRAVFRNFLISLTWGALLSAVTIVSVAVLPLLLLSLPVLAYASFDLYRSAFPLQPPD